MVNKKLTTMFASILALVLMISFVSAIDVSVSHSSISLNSIDTQAIVTFTNNDNNNINLTIPNKEILTQGNYQITLTPSQEGQTITLENKSSKDITITATGDLDNFELGSESEIFNFYVENSTNSSDNTTKEVSVSFQGAFCGYSNKGDYLEVENLEFDTKEGFGDDEDYWYPLDEVEIEFEVENNEEYDLEDLEVEIIIYDKNDDYSKIYDEDDMDLSDDEFDLDDREDITITATLFVDADELNEDGEYVVYVKVTGEVDDSDSPFDGDNTCESASKEIEIKTDEFIIIDKTEIIDLDNFNEDNVVSCGSEVELRTQLWNIDSEKIDDDEVFINIYNKELGIDKNIEFTESIRSLDYEELVTRLNIPSDAEEKFYQLTISIYDDEDMEDGDLYESSEDDTAEYTFLFEVANCQAIITEPTITANLGSEAKVQEDLIVNVEITNPGEEAIFVLSVSNYDSWAELADGSNQIIQLDEDESQTVEVKLNPTESGAQTFNIVLTDVNGNTYTQPVSISVKEKTGLLTGAFSGVGETGLYIVAGIVLLLIIIVIILIVKVASRPTVQEF